MINETENEIITVNKSNESCSQIRVLFEKYNENSYITNKLHNYICSQLPNILENQSKNHNERIIRIKELTVEQKSFTHSFLSNNQFFYCNTTERFFYYDGIHYNILIEDDILHYILSTISKGRQLLCWKQKTRIFIMKRIKDNSIFNSIPETDTIQNVLDLLYPTIFSSKSEAKYFLTIIGDSILKKNNELIHFLNPSAKKFIRELNNACQSIIGQNLYQTIKYKYHEHEYSLCRLLSINKSITSDNVWKPVIDNAIDLICVAVHYSIRYLSSDEYIIKFNNDMFINDNVFYLKNNTQTDLVLNFISEYLQKKNIRRLSFHDNIDDISNNVTNISNNVTNMTNQNINTISWKNMQYLWKHYLDSINLPNIMFQQTLKQLLVTQLSEHYNDKTDIFIGICSKFLPAIQKFIAFWEETITLDDNEIKNGIETNDYEIEEICHLFKQWCKIKGMNNDIDTPKIRNSDINETQLLDLINFFYPNIEIEQNKYINKIQCSLWYKQIDIQMAMDSLKQSLINKYSGNIIGGSNISNDTDFALLQNTVIDNENNISIYDAYIYYCKFIITYDPITQIINKSYFDKYINENYSKYIIDNRFLSILWTTQ